MAQPTVKTARTATANATAKVAPIFNIKREAYQPEETEEIGYLAGTFKDYLVDAESMTLSDNVDFPVVDIKNDKMVNLKIVYEDGQEGWLYFSKRLSAKLRNKAIKLANMFNYDVRIIPIVTATGEAVELPVIQMPKGGSRKDVKIPNKEVVSASDMW